MLSKSRPPPTAGGLVEAMSCASFYPHRPGQVELIETHISWVFVAGELVYKVKKPVVFPFLDYGSAERRRFLCQEEVRLNRRLAPSLYLAVRGLARRREGWVLTGPDDASATEHAVEMRRFDEECTLARRLLGEEADGARVVAVGRRIAEFHRSAGELRPGGGGATAHARVCGENFDSLLTFVDGVLTSRQLAAAQRFNAAFLLSRRSQIDSRAWAGRVRDCHGDLRAEHVLFLDGGVEIFDCIEFSPDLRMIDVGADLAFLVMDLEARGRSDLALGLAAAYRAAGGDPGDDALLAYFAVYRAWVRAKVACLRSAELDAEDPGRGQAVAEARRLAALARRLAWRARGPLVMVICGGTASGKTHLASGLARASGLAHLNSDVVRKALLGLKPTERAPERAYGDELNARTYAELGRRAAAGLATGGVIVDATFRHRADRDCFGDALGSAAPVFVECRAPRDVLERRAGERMRAAERVSDADPALVGRQLREFAPLDEIPASTHLVVRTDRAVAGIEDDVEALLDSRLASGEGQPA